MAFSFKVGYTTDPTKIGPAIQDGRIDEGDLVIVNEDGKGSIYFVLQDKSILPFTTEVDPEQIEEAVNNAIENLPGSSWDNF